MKLILLACLLCTQAFAQFSAITRGASFSSTSTLSWTSPSVNAGDLAVVTIGANFPTGGVSTVTWNGVSMTKAQGQQISGGTTEIWYLLSPATGAHTVVITASANWDSAFAGAATYAGINQTTPIDASNNNSTSPSSSTSLNATATLNTAGDIVVDSAFQASVAVTLSATSPSTRRQNGSSGAGGSLSWATSDQTFSGTGTGTMAWTSPSSAVWIQTSVSLKSASAATNSATPSHGGVF